MKIAEVTAPQPSGWLYHATTIENVDWGILDRGLRSGAKRRATFPGYEDWVKGKIFFADTPEAARIWFQKLHNYTMKPIIMLRVPSRDVHRDPHGEQEAPGSVYTWGRRNVVPVKEIQFWHPQQGWVPLTWDSFATLDDRSSRGHEPPQDAYNRVTEGMQLATRPELPEYLYHGTNSLQVKGIIQSGIRPPSWWGTEEVAFYYAQSVAEEEGGEPAIITVPFTAFNQQMLEPDGNSIDEPLTHTLGRTEKDLYSEWENSSQTWLDSLNIYGSVIYRQPISVTRQNIQVSEPAKTKPRPDQWIAQNYRRLLRLTAWGKIDSTDQQTKARIEQQYDVSDIKNLT